MGWIVNIVLFVASVLALGGLVAYVAGRLAYRTAGKVRRMPVVRKIPMIGVRPPEPPVAIDADLRAYPERLLVLESRLGERHAAVQEQLRLLAERRQAVAGKAERHDLVSRYDDDIGHLDRRAASMRRVMALVWRARAVLALRVFHAVTGRLRPRLPSLPDGSRKLGRDELLRARSSYLEAATAVKFYIDELRERLRALSEVVPPAPVSAEVDDEMLAAVDDERRKVVGAHEALLARMDRLVDNLTWLADHAGTLHVVDDDVALPGPAPGGASASHLLEEVDSAVAALNALAGAVDRHVADRALEELADDVGRLETLGLEEQAAAQAELEVARLVEGFSS